MNDQRVEQELCSRCFGVGVLDEIIVGRRIQDVECPACHGTGRAGEPEAES